MTKTTDTIKITKRKDGFFSLKKDKNLLHMIGMANSIQKVVFELSIIEGKTLTNADTFVALLNKITESEKSILSPTEAFILNEWIDCLCLFHLEIEGVNYSEKDMKKFLKLAQDFLKKTKSTRIKQ